MFLSGNAVLLDFPDESFDAVTSNYVYHNIARADKQALLMETLRVLKKWRCFCHSRPDVSYTVWEYANVCGAVEGAGI